MRLRLPIALMLFTLLTACAGNMPRMLSPWLSSEELHDLFIGKTVESVNVKTGVVSRTYYEPDGRVMQLREGKGRSGYWRISEKGRICLGMEGGADKCRAVKYSNGKYQKYIVKKDGHHQMVIEYRSFQPGNRL